jgi:DNA polymerase I
MSELDIYITNTETIYSEYDDAFTGIGVRLYGREADGTQRTVTVTGFEPYFYILASEKDNLSPSQHQDLERYEETSVKALEDRFNHLTPGVETRKLARVVVSHPGAVPKVRDHYDVTWNADVRFTNRFRIDSGVRSGVRVHREEGGAGSDEHIIVDKDDMEPIEMEDTDPRICMFDIETDDRDSGFPSPGDARLLSIVAYDSYEDEYTGWIDLDGEPFHERFDISQEQLERHADDDDPFELSLEVHLGIDEIDNLNYEKDERRMLMSFGSWVNDRDPDIIGGWNSGDTNADGFDLPHLIERMKVVGASPSRLSREGHVEVDEYDGDYTVELGGRSAYDFMDAWASTKFTEPDSKRLDDVAADKLDDAKIEHPDQGFFEMYRDDPAKFLNYNGKDVRLVKEIVEEEGVIEFKKRLKDMIGVDWEEVRENNDFVSMSVRRKCYEHGVAMVTARDNPRVQEDANKDGVNYEGAYVFPSFRGLKKNIVGIDLASLYPMTQWMLNASPDTKIDQKIAFQHDIDHVVAENDVAFRTDVDSIIRELVDEYDEIKMEYKRKRNAATPGTDEHEKLALIYGVAKTIYNSYYGYTGWALSPIYDPEIAAAVTLTGQVVIKRTADHLSASTEGEIVYGDTDSTYSSWPEEWSQKKTLETVNAVCDELNNEVYPGLCDKFLIDREDNEWFIELEMRARRMFMSGSKKHYAYEETWEEGMDFDEVIKGGDGKVSITGYACIKSNTAGITSDVMEDTLTTIVTGGSQEDVVEIIHGAASSIDASDPDWEYLGMPQGLGKKIPVGENDNDDYYAWSKTRDTPKSAHARGAWFANHMLDVEYDEGDKPKRAYLKETMVVNQEPVDVICYEYERDLEPVEDTIQMDISEMQEKTLMNPMEDILESFDLEPTTAIQGKVQEQSGLEAFM